VYAGHFAAGLALKAKEPAAPTWGILPGVGLLDLLFGPFVLAGVERVTVTPGVSPGFSLDHIDWSHSLLMAVIWSVVFGMLFVRWGRRVAVIAGVAVFSHFVLDLPMHPPDLAIWPGARAHLGFGLWRRLPTGWWFVEAAFVAVAWGYYFVRAREATHFGRWPVAVGAVLAILHLANSPWLSAL